MQILYDNHPSNADDNFFEQKDFRPRNKVGTIEAIYRNIELQIHRNMHSRMQQLTSLMR